jgi:secreted trypsin-like serine protease
VFNHFSILFLDFSKCGINANSEKIVDEQEAGFWPWMASLGSRQNNQWKHQCGATIISNIYFITAAHCVVSNKDEVKKRFVFKSNLT